MQDRPARAAAPRRRTQEERTQETQQKLIRSTIDLLKKRRYVGLRTSEVAEHAGLSKGASTHHFPTKDTLVLKALEEVFRHTQARALARIDAAGPTTGELLDAMVEDSKAFFLSDDFLLSLDLVMVDPTSTLGSAVKTLARQYRLPVEQAWVDALQRLGHPREQAEHAVRLTFALARGFGIRQLIAGPEAAADPLMAVWRKTAETVLGLSPTPAPQATPRLAVKPRTARPGRST